jgi:hypothetical protein
MRLEMENFESEIKEDKFQKFLDTPIGGVIGIASLIITFIVTAVTFFGCWAYAIAEYGWFLGLALGWIPSLIIAGITLVIVQAISPALVILMALSILGFVAWLILL